MRPATKRPRQIRLTIAYLATFALAALVFHLSHARDAEFQIQVQNADPAWRIDWPNGPARNGHWIDLAESLGTPAATKLLDGAVTLRVRVAINASQDIALRWEDSAGAHLRIDSALIDDQILGIPTGRTPLRILRIDNARSSTGLSLPLHADLGDGGGIYFALPAAPPAWGLILLLASAAATAATTFAACTWWLTGWIHRRFARTPTPAARPAITAIALAIIIALPIALAAWTPMIISGDGIEYMQLALRMLGSHDLSAFNGWRLPGYPALMLPFLATMQDFVRGIGWAQAAMAIATPLLCRDMLRRRAAPPWPALGALLVAIDPALLIWQRSLLTEAQTAFLITLSSWLLLITADKLRARPTDHRPLALSAALGAALAAACYTRPNLQVFAVLAPVALAFVAPTLRTRLIPPAICLATTLLLLSPILIHNARAFGRPALVVGTDWNRAVWAWEDDLMDWNQSEVFTFDQFTQLRARCRDHTISSFTFPDLLQSWQTPPAPKLPPRAQMDVRCAQLWQESAARRPDMFLAIMPKAFGSLMGLRTSHPAIFHHDARFLAAPLLADTHECPDGTNWLTGFDHEEEPRFLPTVHPIRDLPRSLPARILAAAFNSASALRPVQSLAFLLAALILIRRKDHPLAFLSLILIIHMAAVAIFVFCGNDRYAMPWYGLMTTLTIAALAPPRN